MFILYFALWVILCGKWTLEIGAFGLVFAAVAYVFSCMFMGYSPKIDSALIRRAPGAIRYGVLLVKEIVKSNIAVIRMILDRKFKPEPQLVQFDTDLSRERHRVTLANSITLTPGTITVSLSENCYLVHCLDTSMMEDLDRSAFVLALEEMERAHAKPAKQPDEELPQTEEFAAEQLQAEGGEEALVMTGEFVSEEAETPEEILEIEVTETDDAEKEGTADA